MTSTISLEKHGIQVETIIRNPAPARLYEEALQLETGSAISSAGALIAVSGKKTGRSPSDKRIVDHPDSRDNIWWGSVNVKLEEHVFDINRERAIDYLNTRKRLFVIDGFAGWDPKHRIKVRIICERAYHALFMWNMLIRPTAEELENYGEPDYVVYNAGRFPANQNTKGMTSKTSVALSFERGEFIILGTEYAGEMKKGVFTIMNYLMPKQGLLSMHCSATEGNDGDVSVLFGLSGTGKTTLSADPKRKLLGDDEHVWSDRGVFNIEGGCYAKCINLTREQEPEIWDAIRFGSVLENVKFDPATRLVDYSDVSLTENTRCSYPIEFIPNAKIPCVGGTPKNVIFLTCDAFSVLPPVAKLNAAQAQYHFMSGYTAKVAGTEMGDLLRLFRRAVHGVAPRKVRRTARAAHPEERSERLAGQHRLVRWPLRHRKAHEPQIHSRHHRRDPRWLAPQSRVRSRPHLRHLGAERRQRRPVGGARAQEHLEGKGRLRRDGQEAGPTLQRQLQEVRRSHQPRSRRRRPAALSPRAVHPAPRVAICRARFRM